MPGPTRLDTLRPPDPLDADHSVAWMLDPDVAYLNHGCFGARPREVSEAQSRRRAEFERQPITWLERQREAHLARAKGVVGPFAGMAPGDFGFVTNATGGINAVLRSLRFAPGDELLTTNHVYNAIRNAMRWVAAHADATYREIEIPVPLHGPDQIIAAITDALTDRTRLLVIDHITSPTAIIFPVDEIVALCARRGVDVAIDGAHAPGMIDLDIEAIGAAYYAANLHKWVCAPVGAAFLWVRPDRQASIHPMTISHFLDEGLANEFAWQGTRDITPWLGAADAIELLGRCGWDRIRRHNHELATWVQMLLAERWQVTPITPADGSMLGSMCALPLPNNARSFESPEQLQGRLHAEHRLEVPIFDWCGEWYVRPSCQVYNRAAQYELLADAVLALISQES